MICASGQGTWVTGSVAPVEVSESARSFPGSPAWSGTQWKLRATREDMESERSQKDFGRRNAGAEERRVRADWESVRKRTD